MTVNYSTSVNFNGQNYGVKEKSPAKQAAKGAIAGAVALGTASLGYQKLILSDSLKEFKTKVIVESAKEMMQGKKGIFTRLMGDMVEIRLKGKLDWAKAGKLALIGGAVVAGISALVASSKNKKAEAQVQASKYPYYA